LENFYLIHLCEVKKFRVFLNCSNSDVIKKFNQINRDPKAIKKFVLVIEAVKANVANKTQFNKEGSCDLGDIYAIKVNNHRFYTLVCKKGGYKELYISRYGRKQSQKNSKKLTTTINSIAKVSFQILLK